MLRPAGSTLRAGVLAPLVALVLLLLSVSAAADVNGTPPTLLESYRVFGNSVAVGNSLMRSVPAQPLVNAVLLAESAAAVRGVPAGATVEAAYLFWSGSIDEDAGVDNTARIRLPSGGSRTVRADRCLTARIAFGGGIFEEFMYCRADVTGFVAGGSSSGAYNGNYVVGDVTAMPGVLRADGTCVESTCQAMYGGWSLVIVWSSDTEPTLRDVAVYDGFQAYDETPTSAGVASYTIAGFDVADPPEASIRIFGMEGDALLGVPPQDSDPVLRCTSCFDYLAINGTKLSDAFNPANNLFNSTVPDASAIGIDIDSFDISGLVRSGDSSVRVEVGSGDGNPATGHANGAGGGELFLVGYNVVTVNRLAPNFRNTRTRLSVDPTEAAPGDSLFYTIDAANTGSLDSRNTRIRFDLPPQFEYVPGSTRLDGAEVADVGGTSPLFTAAGLNVGTVPTSGDNEVRVTFRVRVRADVPDGTLVTTDAEILSADLTEPTVTNEVTVRINAPTLLTPQKTWTDLNGGLVEPGDFITYTITIRKTTDASAAALEFVDDLPREVRLTSVNGGGFTDASEASGGTDGTGLVRITDISIPRGSDRTTISFTVRVKSAGELVADGIDPSALDGLPVSNQGELRAAFLPSSLRTDDPTTAALADPTVFRLSSAVNFRNADTNKTAVDVDGGTLVPGDDVRFTIQLRNTGNQAATVNITDDLPAFLEAAALESGPAGVVVLPTGGAFGSGRIEASGLSVAARSRVTIVVRARVRADAPGGTVIANVARLRVPLFPDQDQDLAANELTVVAGPDFTGTTKTASGATGGFEPGDEVLWTITLPNSGTTTARTVTVTDRVDASLTAITPLDGGTYDAATRTVRWTVTNVAPGASATVRFRSRISAGATDGTVIRNQASVSADGGAAVLSDDPATADADDPTEIRVEALPALTLSKTVTALDGGAFEPGNRVRYTLTLRNDGRAASGAVTVRDPLPAGVFEAVAPGQGGALRGDAVVWNATTTPALAAVAAGASVTLTIDATLVAGVADGLAVDNQAELVEATTTTLSDDPATPALLDPTRFIVSAEPLLSVVSKTFEDLNGGAPQPGDTIVWTVRVENTGSGAASDLVVSDVLPAGLTDVVPENGGIFSAGTREVLWTPAAALPAGGSIDLRVRTRIAPGTANGTVIANQASVEAAGVAPILSDDPGTAAPRDATRLVVEARPDFATSTKEIVGGGVDGLFRPGDDVVYRIVVTNTGNENAANVVVTDVLDPALGDPVATAGGTVTGSTVRWNVGALAAGASVELGLRATLDFPLADGLVVPNQATITATGVTAQPTDDPTTDDLDDPTSLVVTARPDLTSTFKTVTDLDGGSFRPGDQIEYVIEVRNTGTDAAANVTVTDRLAAELVDVEPGDAVLADGVLTWNASTTPGLANVAPGDAGVVVLTFRARLADAIENATIVGNQAVIQTASATFVSDDPSTAALSDETRLQVVSSFDFSSATKVLSIVPDDGIFRPGTEIEYRIDAANTGDAPARNVVVVDPFPAELEFLSASNGGRFDGTNVRWTAAETPELAIVQPGEGGVLFVRARVRTPLDDGTVVANQAQIGAPGAAAPFVTDDPATAAVDDPTTFTVTSTPGIRVTKTVRDTLGDGVIEPGDRVAYTLVVTNTGDAVARDVVVTDPVDVSALDDLALLDGARFDGTTLTWDSAGLPALASLAPGAGAAVTLRFEGTVRAGVGNGTLVANQASGAAADVAPQPSDDPSTPTANDPTLFTVVAAPRLDVATKTVVDLDGAPTLPGDRLEYAITLRNDGSEAATGVFVTDPLDAALVDVEALDAGVVAGSTLRWDLGRLDPGASVTVRFRATVDADVPDGGRIANQANVGADGLESILTDDPSTPEPSDPTVVVVNETPDLVTSTKVFFDLNGGAIQPNDAVRYEIVVRNTGAGTARNVVVTDRIDASLLVDVVADEAEQVGDTLVFSSASGAPLEAIGPGEQVVLSIVARIAPDAPNASLLANQAEVSDEEGRLWLTDDPATAESSDPTVVEILFPELQLATKSVVDLNGGSVEPGDRLVYSIRFGAGVGPALTNVVVVDRLDPLLTDVFVLGGGVWDESTRTVTWDPTSEPALASVEQGEQRTLEFEVTVRADAQAGALIANQAALTSDEDPVGALTDDPATDAIDDATVVEVSRAVAADLSTTTKSVEDLNGGLVEPGDTLRYRVVVTNTGDIDTLGLAVIDPLPSLLALVPGSATVDGLPLDVDAEALASGVALPELAAGQSLELVFDAVVSADAPVGAVIDNVALASDEDGGLFRSDDPSTADEDDATRVIVGAAPDLSSVRKTAEPVDENGDGFPQIGESIIYTIRVTNRGTDAADNVVFVDELPETLVAIAGSLTVDGISLSDAADADVGVLETRLVRVDLGRLPAGATAEIVFRAAILAGPLVVNQGRLVSDLTDDLTDDDGDDANGDNPTLTAVDGSAALPTATKSVTDANGGTVEPGDLLVYTLRLGGTAALEQPFRVVDVPDEGVFLESVIALPTDTPVTFVDGTATIDVPALAAGDERVVLLSARVAAGAGAGQVLCNRLEGTFALTPDPACVTVGGTLGAVRVQGTVFRELGVRNGLLDVATDQGLGDFVVRFSRPLLKSAPIDVPTDAEGRYETPTLAPGLWLAEAWANGGPANGGARFAATELDVPDGATFTTDLLIEPTGIVYDIESLAPRGSVRAMVYWDDTDLTPGRAGQLVDAALLEHPSQQGQFVPGNGIYRIRPTEPGRYRIELEPQGALAIFPSLRLPALDELTPLDGRTELAEVAVPDPASEAELPYTLRFAVTDGGDELANNHVPVDPLDGYLTVAKRADRVSAWVGDIVTYTVTVTNRSTTPLVYDEALGRGGVTLVDAIPRPFRLVRGSAVGSLRTPTGEERLELEVEGDLLLTFFRDTDAFDPVPLELPGESELEIRYQLVLGSETEPGESYVNYVELQSADGGALLAEPASATVRVDYDPVFDQGVLIGKVFCDVDGDGRQQRGERPLPGARIYLDTGYYTHADEAGQYHFADIDPGLHLVKIEVNTLPPGSTLVTDERRLMNVTRGLPSQIDFAVSCVENVVDDVQVLPGDDTLAESERLRRARFFEVSARPATGWLSVDGEQVRLVDVAAVARAGSDAPPAPALYPAPTDEEGSGAVPLAERAAPGAVSLRVADGALVEPVSFAFAASGAPTRWVVEVADLESGIVVFQAAGDGAPPATWTWDGRSETGALMLAGRRNYGAVLRVFGGDATFATSAPVVLAVAGTETRYLLNERFSGATFQRNRVSTELADSLRALRTPLLQTGTEPVVVEVHADDDDARTDELEQTQAQADAVAAWLRDELGVPADRLVARGRGIEAPLYPNIGDRTRLTNRRVEVRVVDPRPGVLAPPAAPALGVPAALRANERAYAAVDGVVAERLLRPADGLVVLELGRPDGGTSAALVAVRDAAEIPSVARQVLPEVPVSVDVSGRVATVGGATRDLAALGMRIAVSPSVAPLTRNRVGTPFSFEPSAVPDEVSAWRLEVFSDLGARVWQTGGEGTPPRALRWTGETDDGAPPDPGSYTARLTVRLTGGGLAATPETALRIVLAEEIEGAVAEEIEVDATPRVLVDGAAIEARGGLWATSVRSVTGRSVVVDVTSDGARLLVPVRVPDGFGATLQPGVELLPQLVLDLDALAPLDSSEPGPSEPFSSPQADPAPVPAAEMDADAPPVAPARRGRDRNRDEPDADEPSEGSSDNPFSDASGGAAPAPAPAPEPEPEPEPAPAPEPEPAPADPDNPFAPISSASPYGWGRPMAAPAMLLQIEAASPTSAFAGVEDTAPPEFEELAGFYARELDLALSTDDGAGLAALLAAAPAGELAVQLPPVGVPLQSHLLPVYGTTHPDNRIFVNGVELPVFEGAFNTVVELPSGASTLVVETRDVDGNRGLIEWPVEVANARYFVMALGDTAVGTRHADIAGRHDHNSIETDSGVVLYGQARAYFKGWLNGEQVLNGYFDELAATAHVDTGRRREYEGFAREVIQPERWYPVFGDSSEQVSDVNARGKVYVLLTADESSATFGNFATDMQGVELFRYDRNLYGGQVVFDDVIAENYRTELRAHVADEDASVGRAFNYLRGTGGSIYYLDRRPVVEGSERVAIVVRDRSSGLEIARTPLSRNVDYTIRYSEGRLLMKSPVPSVMDDVFMLGGLATSRSTLVGHPVYVEVAFDHEGTGDANALAWGLHGRETFFDLVSVGGGTVRERRAGNDYELWSVEAGVGRTQTSRVDFEYARSVSNDLAYRYSDDGGLQWSEFRLDRTDDEDGEAVFARGRFELADFIESERSAILGLETYYRNQQRGFFSNGTVLDQGEQRYGTLVRWNVTASHSLSARFDSSLTEVDDVTTEATEDTASIQRSATAVQYEYALDPVDIGLGYQHTFTDDDRAADGYENDIITAGIGVRVLRWLHLGVDHEIVANGTDPRLVRGAGDSNETRIEDRFITGLTATVELPTDIELSVSERFRYSGENSTAIGLRAGMGDEGDIYVQQRLSSFRGNSGTAATTVVGGEQRFGEDGSGRTYGEYHVDTGTSAARTRAVMGFGKRWEVLRGLSFDLGYERSEQISGDNSASRNSRDTGSLGWEFVRLRHVKVSGLLEARFDHGAVSSPLLATCLADDISGNPSWCQDRVTSVGDRRQTVAALGVEWKWTRDLTFLTRLDLAFTRNLTLDAFEARDVEASVGIAYRPVDVNWLNVLSRYTWLDEMAPYELELDTRRRDSSHVLSLSPIYELPWNLQLVQKFAWRRRDVFTEGLPGVRNDLMLLIHRLNYHLTRQWDVGAEYRFLHQSLTSDWQHGVLLEVNYILAEHVRLGVGYNFTRFAEDELGDFDRDASGVFFRVTAQY
jgi:uncharacterized repeat protein (TIGR01451 family)